MNKPPPFPVSGAVLAGGRSSRMGRDKAFLLLDGVPLVARQTALLGSLGLEDLLISGRAGIDYAVPTARVVTDPVADAGPLAGLAAVLAAVRHPWVLVVAVDVPRLTATFLQRILDTGAGRIGVAPHAPHGFEPLVALYPRALLPRIEAALAERRLGLQALLADATRDGLMIRMDLSDADLPLLANWNAPEDLHAP